MATKSGTDTIHAWVYHSASGGLPRNLQLLDDVPSPVQKGLGKDDLLVKVQRASLNPADYKIPEAGFLTRLMVSPPATPGMDFAGTVAETGTGVSSFSVGQRVMGKVDFLKYGSLSTYLTVPATACAVVPEEVSMDHAACVATAAGTAYQSIVPNVKEGDKVFINGGSGGVGIFCIQVAKTLGCHVTTTCSGRNADFCRELGADEVIDYTKEDVARVLKSKGPVYKLVVDNVGLTIAQLFGASAQYLVPEGRYVQIGFENAWAILKAIPVVLLPSFLGGVNRKYSVIFQKSRGEEFAQIGRWIAEGKVKTNIDATFEYKDAPKAFERLKTGRTRGKIIVKVSE